MQILEFNELTIKKPRQREKSKKEILVKAKMHFMNFEKWFLMPLKVEYFHYHQQKLQFLKYFNFSKITNNIYTCKSWSDV